MRRQPSTLPKVQVRMTEEMRSTLQSRASNGYRSVNAEIISLLERGLAAEANEKGA